MLFNARAAIERYQALQAGAGGRSWSEAFRTHMAAHRRGWA